MSNCKPGRSRAEIAALTGVTGASETPYTLRPVLTGRRAGGISVRPPGERPPAAEEKYDPADSDGRATIASNSRRCLSVRMILMACPMSRETADDKV